MPIGRIRNDLPIAIVRSDLPQVRSGFGAFLSAGIDTVIQLGTPIGLLLVLTYSNTFTVSTSATFKGISPVAHIRNTD